MSERGFILKVVKGIEELGCLAYAYKDSNETGSFEFWNVCVDDYSLYCSERMKKAAGGYHLEAKRSNVRVLFSYCEPTESGLIELANKGNLIMNIV